MYMPIARYTIVSTLVRVAALGVAVSNFVAVGFSSSLSADLILALIFSLAAALLPLYTSVLPMLSVIRLLAGLGLASVYLWLVVCSARNVSRMDVDTGLVVIVVVGLSYLATKTTEVSRNTTGTRW